VYLELPASKHTDVEILSRRTEKWSTVTRTVQTQPLQQPATHFQDTCKVLLGGTVWSRTCLL